jgi:hypothetical protein
MSTRITSASRIAVRSLATIGLCGAIFIGCRSKITGNEGNFDFSYIAGDLNTNQNGQTLMTTVEEQKTKASILFQAIETLKIQLGLLSTFDLPIQKMSPHFFTPETFLSQHPPGGLLILREQVLQKYAPTIRDQLHQNSKSKVT